MTVLSSEVLLMLIPTGGWATSGDEYEGVQFISCTPITKEQFEQGKLDYPAWNANQDAAEQAKKDAIAATLEAKTGLTLDQLKSVLNP